MFKTICMVSSEFSCRDGTKLSPQDFLLDPKSVFLVSILELLKMYISPVGTKLL